MLVSMLFKSASTVCADVSRYDMYYSYPIVYYYVTGEVNQRLSDVPVAGGVRVESYCINLDVHRLVVHYVEDTGDAVVEAIDKDGNPVDPVVVVDALYDYLTGARKPRTFTPHEVRAMSLLFTLDAADVESILKYYRYLDKLEDKYVAIIGESVYVFSRNPRVILMRIDDPEAVAVAHEKSIVSRAPVKDMREHIKLFINENGDGITVFVSDNSALWCDAENCFAIRTPSNITRLMLRDLDLQYVEVDISSPKRYRDVDLTIPSDYIVISKNVLLLRKTTSGKLEVVDKIENAGFSTTSPLVFSKRGFEGFAHVVMSKGVRVKIVRKSAREVRDIEEAENIAAVI